MLTDEDKEWIDKRLEKIETALLTEFWKWGRTADMRYRQDHDSVATLDQRVQAMEDRITALERGRPR
jgi:hypothetical protein